MSCTGLVESYGPEQTRRRMWIRAPDDRLSLSGAERPTRQTLFDRLCCVARSVFLPHGYPHTVTADYVPYQVWDTVQAFASSLSGALATEAVLKGAGVGDAAATPLAATITWLMKDGAGMLGRIAFAYKQGTSLDADCKRWRLAADALNDAAMLINLVAALLPRYAFTYCMCSAALCHAVVGVAGGATRAAVTQHQARRQNLADVSAKDGSQETMVNLAALVVSLLMVPAVSGHLLLVWLLFASFTCVHLYANYRAVRALSFDTFNQARLEIVCREYALHGRVCPPLAVNAKESVAPWRTPYSGPRLHLGVSVSEAFGDTGGFGELPDVAVRMVKQFKYVCLANGKVLLQSGAGAHDAFMAACVAVFMRQGIVPSCDNQESAHALLEQSAFATSLQSAGWRTDCLLINDHDWRVQLVTHDLDAY